MSYINESCGCDSNSQATINTSPILSGAQEAAFSPQNNSFSFLDGMNDNILGNNQNNFSNNDESKKNYSLDDLISMSNQNNKENENKFSYNNIQEMNQQPNFNMNQGNSMGEVNVNQILNNIPNINTRTNNNLPDSGMMRNTPSNVNPELQAVMNKIAAANQLNAINKANEIIEKKLSVRQTEKITAEFKNNKKKKTSKDPNILDLEKELSDKIGLKTSIQFNDNGSSGSLTL